MLGDFYDQCGPRLYRYALLILGDAAAAEDAVQETFCSLTRLIGRNGDGATLAYAIRAVRNQSYTILRSRRRRQSVASDALLEPCAPDASEEERLILDEALRELPVEQREVVHLKVFEGMTFQEIASLCDVSANTAASRYRYAMAALRRALSATERTP